MNGDLRLETMKDNADIPNKETVAPACNSPGQGRPLWAVLLEFVERHGSVARGEIISRFGEAQPAVPGVLKALVASGLLFRTGRGDLIAYRAVQTDEGLRDSASKDERAATFAWAAIQRYGPLTRGQIAEYLSIGDDAVDGAISRLLSERFAAREENDGIVTYSSTERMTHLRKPAGFE